MYKGKKISVAMATYNGEKYIEKQLMSIINQTVTVDEIIVSDDGSKDGTLDIVRKTSLTAKEKGTDIVVITDNPRHGYNGNFEWAVKHTTGDYIFLSDQDDIWLDNRIERVAEIFLEIDDAWFIVNEAQLIDKRDNELEGVFNKWRANNILGDIEEPVYKLESSKYNEIAVGLTFPGMVMAFKRELLDTIIPFPRCSDCHDKWITFCAVLTNKAYYIPDILCKYRLHGQNTAGNSAYTGSFLDKIKKINSKTKLSGLEIPCGELILSEMQMEMLKEYGDMYAAAVNETILVSELAKRQIDIAKKGRISGAIELMRLYHTSLRYKRTGRNAHILQVCRILKYSKRKRAEYLEGFLK